MCKLLRFLLALDVSYVGLAFLQHISSKSTFPARRHLVSPSSRFWILVHILAGAVVIYVGAAIFVTQKHSTVPEWPLFLMAAAGLVHSTAVLPLFSKVVGIRKLTVPWYCGINLLNIYNSIALFQDRSFGRGMQLWSSMNTFLWVRYFYFALDILSGSADKLATYTVALGASSFLGLLAGPCSFWWLLMLTAPLIGSPFMVLFDRLFYKLSPSLQKNWFVVLVHEAFLPTVGGVVEILPITVASTVAESDVNSIPLPSGGSLEVGRGVEINVGDVFSAFPEGKQSMSQEPARRKWFGVAQWYRGIRSWFQWCAWLFVSDIWHVLLHFCFDSTRLFF